VLLYQQFYANPVLEIKEYIEEIELDFLLDDLPRILDSMQVGAERISEIVLSLRNFSRLDEAGMKKVDIHHGLDSTLLILQNRFKGLPKKKIFNFSCGVGVSPAQWLGRTRCPPHKIE
jgi:two-component system NtrC family sensor kinase